MGHKIFLGCKHWRSILVMAIDHSRESDGMQLPLAIIVAVFCVIAITFLGLGAKLLYQVVWTS